MPSGIHHLAVSVQRGLVVRVRLNSMSPSDMLTSRGLCRMRREVAVGPSRVETPNVECAKCD
jgi:hypothetical protein